MLSILLGGIECLKICILLSRSLQPSTGFKIWAGITIIQTSIKANTAERYKGQRRKTILGEGKKSGKASWKRQHLSQALKNG